VVYALSREPEVCSAERAPKCGWYQCILTGVKNRSVDFPDYRIERGKLYRHILHELDYREVEEGGSCTYLAENRTRVLKSQHDDLTACILDILELLRL